MELYILRHAIAVERGTPGYKDDSTRPLTPEGRTKMQENTQGLKALGITLDFAFSSPYIRARQTAEIVTGVIKPKHKLIITEHLIPEPSFEGLINDINAHAKTSHCVLLVGHEPHLSEFISFLLRSRRQIAIDFKKGGLCHLSIKKLTGAGCAVLNSLLTPTQLRLMKPQRKSPLR